MSQARPNTMAKTAAVGICASALALSSSSRATGPWQDYRARGILSWVKTSSQKSCLETPWGSVKNLCASVAEVDVPLPYDFGGGWHSVDASLFRSGGSQPFCQVLGIGADGAPEVVGPLWYAANAGWNSLPLGKAQAPSGGTFVACWLYNGDVLDSVNWDLSGTDP